MSDNISFYNPLFDTVIQRRNYMNLRHCMQKETEKKINTLFAEYYVGILRWQMLVVGRVILTDSMWYDSIFLKLLMREPANVKDIPNIDSEGVTYENTAFGSMLRFVRDNIIDEKPPIEIRARGKHVQMFCTNFYFSSVNDSGLRDNLLKAGDDIAKDVIMEILDPEEAIKAYLQQMDDKINDKNDEYKKFKKDMEDLSEGLGRISTFSYEEGNWPDLGVNGDNPIKQAFESLKGSFGNIYSENDRQSNPNLRRMYAELCKERPVRSTMEGLMDSMLGGLEKTMIEDFYQTFENEYAIAISKSQKINYLNCREIIEKALFMTTGETERNGNAICSAMKFLGVMSWKDFQRLYDVAKSSEREKEVQAALSFSDRKYVLLDGKVGGIKAGEFSLYDKIFREKVVFFPLSGKNRILIPERFEDKIYCKHSNQTNGDSGDYELEYKRCRLFSNGEDVEVESYFFDDFDEEATKALLCPLYEEKKD